MGINRGLLRIRRRARRGEIEGDLVAEQEPREDRHQRGQDQGVADQLRFVAVVEHGTILAVIAANAGIQATESPSGILSQCDV